MKLGRLPLVIAAWVLLGSWASLSADTVPRMPSLLPSEAREPVSAVAEQIICYCGCATQTVRDCECAIADDLRLSIWHDLSSGKPASDIVNAYVAEHGTEFRSMPQKKGLGLAAWIVPYAAIALAAAVVLPVVRGWSRKRRQVAPPPAAPCRGDNYERIVDEETSHLD